MLSRREEARLVILNKVIGRELSVRDASEVLGVSERHGWRLLAAYRREGAVALAHGNRGRSSYNKLGDAEKARVAELAGSTYAGLNTQHLTELLAEREGICAVAVLLEDAQGSGLHSSSPSPTPFRH
jgi:transposase